MSLNLAIPVFVSYMSYTLCLHTGWSNRWFWLFRVSSTCPT